MTPNRFAMSAMTTGSGGREDGTLTSGRKPFEIFDPGAAVVSVTFFMDFLLHDPVVRTTVSRPSWPGMVISRTSSSGMAAAPISVAKAASKLKSI